MHEILAVDTGGIDIDSKRPSDALSAISSRSSKELVFISFRAAEMDAEASVFEESA